MSKEVKAAFIAGIFGLIGILLTYFLTSYNSNEDYRALHKELTDYQSNYDALLSDFNDIQAQNERLKDEIAILKALSEDKEQETMYAQNSDNTIFVKDIEPFVGKALYPFDTIRDNLGDNHFNAVGGYSQANAYVTSPANNLYLINGEYSTISGQLFLRENGKNTNKNHTLEIYGDDELLYEASVTGGVKPINFNVDIKDVVELRLVIDGNDTIYAGTLAAVDNFKLNK